MPPSPQLALFQSPPRYLWINPLWNENAKRVQCHILSAWHSTWHIAGPLYTFNGQKEARRLLTSGHRLCSNPTPPISFFPPCRDPARLPPAFTYLLGDGGLQPPTPSATAAPAAPNAALLAEALLPWTGGAITWLWGLQ